MSPASSRCVRVFLSSTFRDFAEERDLLIRKVFPELRRRARERNVEVIDIDLRWGITREQAERGEVLPICLAEIDRARPYFLGFIGDRYGWVPEAIQYDLSLLVEQPWLAEHRGGKSVTELEMLHGVLNNAAMAGRAFFYFRDTEYSQAKGGAYLSESEGHRAKLEVLKTRIRESGFPVMENYPSPEVLAARVQEDLWRVIDEAFPAESVPDPLALERRKHEVYGAARLGLYLGGEKYFVALDQAMKTDPFKPVLITGPSGVGKSALVANWVERYAASNTDARVITHYLGSSADAADLVRMVYRIECEIARVTGEEDKLEGDPNKILQRFPEWLLCASAFAEKSGLEWIVVLDGLDKLSVPQKLNCWPSQLPPRVLLVVSCLAGEIQSAFKARMNPCEVAVYPLSTPDGCELIRSYLVRFNKVLSQADVERIVAHPLGGSPLFLRTVAEEMRVFGVHEQLQQRLNGYLESCSMGEVFAKVFNRVEEDNKHEDMEAVLSVLWGALESFAEDELIALTGLAPAVWSSILNALEGSLISNGGRIAFGHDYLRKAVEDRYVASSEKKTAVMHKLSDFCSERMRSEGRKANSSYVRRQAVQHFIISERWDEAVAALSDLGFIEARAKAKELRRMLVDFADTFDSLPEGKREHRKESARQAALDRYASSLAQYAAAYHSRRRSGAEPEPPFPEAMPSVSILSTREILREINRITERPNCLDLLKAFRIFVASNVEPLEKFSAQEGFSAQLARNDAPAGPVHEEGKRILTPLDCIKLTRKFPPSETYNPMPACEAVLDGHTGPVEAVALSADGRIVVSGSENGTLRTWSLKTGECLKVLEGHTGTVGAVALSADGRIAVSGSRDKTLRVWDLAANECLKILEGNTWVTLVALSAEGRIAVSGSYDRPVLVWDIESGECLGGLDGHTDRVISLTMSADGRFAISGCLDNTLRVWSLETGECLKVLQGGHTCALSADGLLVVSCDYGGILRVWNLETGEFLKVLEISGGIRSFALSADGKFAVSVHYDGTLGILNLETGGCAKALEGHTDYVSSVALTADGRFAVSGSGDKTLRVWDSETGKCLNVLEGHTSKVFSHALSSDGRFAVSGSGDKTLRVWNLETGECLKVLEGHIDWVLSVALSADGRFAVSWSRDFTMRFWNLETGECLHVVWCLHVNFREGHTDLVLSIALSTDGRFVVSGSSDNTLRVWNFETGECINIFEGHTSGVSLLALSADGRFVVSGSRDNTLRVWNLETSECMKVFEGHEFGISSVALTADGLLAVSSGGEGTMRVWNLGTGECLKILEGNTRSVSFLALSADGRFAISGSDDNTLRIWNLETGECLARSFIRGVCFTSMHPDARKLAGRLKDNQITFFGLENLPVGPLARRS